MTNQKKTAWYNDDLLPNEMVRGATGQNGWPRVEFTEHFSVLDSFIKDLDFKKIADIGCGSAELGRIYKNYEYVGFDLHHIIEKVAKVVNPELNYEYFDLNIDNYEKFKNFDMIICNGVLSEVNNPIEKISNILENTKKYFIIHRQFFSDTNKEVYYNTYGELPTIRNIINLNEFKNLMINHSIEKIKPNVWGDTILIKNKNNP